MLIGNCLILEMKSRWWWNDDSSCSAQHNYNRGYHRQTINTTTTEDIIDKQCPLQEGQQWLNVNTSSADWLSPLNADKE